MKRNSNVVGAVCLLVLLVVGAGCSNQALLIQPVSAKRTLKEHIIQKPKGTVRDKVAVIDVDGILVNHAKSGLLGRSDNPVSLFMEKLAKASADRAVKAVVLRINSPGGTIGATDAMHHALTQFKQETGKPVIAIMLDLGASGGYYLACGADGIVAQPSCVTGSIGVILQTMSFKGTLDKIGIKAEAIKSGELKAMGSPLKDMEETERDVLHSIIMSQYNIFLDVVAKARPGIPEDKLRSLADGRVYTAGQALDAGLIDQIGYPENAIAWAKREAGLSRCQVVIYHRPVDYKPNSYATAMSPIEPGALVNVGLPHWLTASG
ncbi:MAG: signal peptide peptidase SppA, partial [Phycisphaeraceae bacterium]|nr:signal peptide peptidase SppA [Phycisphaeraceae bacterium]